MASVYILYSKSINRFYTGSCRDLNERIKEHNSNHFKGFTGRASDWKLFLSEDNLDYKQARNIEDHIKGMKSSKYIRNLKKYPEILEKLKIKYTID